MKYISDRVKAGAVIAAIILPCMLIANHCKGQDKSTFYVKFAPSYLFPKDADNIPAFFAGGGLKVDRYLKVGLGAGYFKFKGSETPFLPLGIDANFSDFGKKRTIFPIAHLQCYYPFYKEENSTGSSSGGTSININSSTKGNFMFQIGGGCAFSINESSKFFITVNYSSLSIKNSVTTKTTVSGSSPRTTSNASTNQINITGITLGFIL